MNNEILFYVFGIALAVSAVLVSIAGLRMKDSFPGKAFPVIVLWFAILVGGATTFAVMHSKDEKADHEVEYKKAGKEIEKETSSGPFEEAGASEEGEIQGEEPAGEEESGHTSKESEGSPSEGAVSGPGGTVELAAAEAELKFDTTELTSKPGKVTIDFNNPSAIPHNVEIEDESGKVLGGTETISSSEESATVELEAGTYTFFCSIPGHRESGMEGTLTVK
ncbi:MAG: cupredoxin domain-containing protein [Solirubrobacterales bacterium]|nr:cupredoxin domain-containing protein [Solirubrobacterales bacterium]